MINKHWHLAVLVFCLTLFGLTLYWSVQVIAEAPAQEKLAYGRVHFDLSDDLNTDSLEYRSLPHHLLRSLPSTVVASLKESPETTYIEKLDVVPMMWHFEGYVEDHRGCTVLLSDCKTGELLYVRSGEKIAGTHFYIEHFTARTMDSVMNIVPGEIIVRAEQSPEAYVLQEGSEAYRQFEVGLRIHNHYVEFSSLGESHNVGADTYTLVSVDAEEAKVCLEKSRRESSHREQIWVSS